VLQCVILQCGVAQETSPNPFASLKMVSQVSFCVAVCCNVLVQCVAVCWCSVWCVTVCCSVLVQCVVCCSVLQWVGAVCDGATDMPSLLWIALDDIKDELLCCSCSVLYCVAVCWCSVLQHNTHALWGGYD